MTLAAIDNTLTWSDIGIVFLISMVVVLLFGGGPRKWW